MYCVRWSVCTSCNYALFGFNLNEYTGLPGYGIKDIPVPRVLCPSYRSHRTLQKFRVRVRKCYRTHRNSGYCGTGAQNSHKFRAGIKSAVPVPRVLVARAYRASTSSGYGNECRSELAEVSGTSTNVLQNLQKFFAR